MIYLKISGNVSTVKIKKLKIKPLIGIKQYSVGTTQSHCVSA